MKKHLTQKALMRVVAAYHRANQNRKNATSRQDYEYFSGCSNAIIDTFAMLTEQTFANAADMLAKRQEELDK